MTKANVTEFIRPNGRQQALTVDVDDKYIPTLKSIEMHGCKLTAERLPTGVVCFCIDHPAGDFRMTLSPNKNADDNVTTFSKMLDSWDESEFNRWVSKGGEDGEPEP
jgi:hypothetical protein